MKSTLHHEQLHSLDLSVHEHYLRKETPEQDDPSQMLALPYLSF